MATLLCVECKTLLGSTELQNEEALIQMTPAGVCVLCTGLCDYLVSSVAQEAIAKASEPFSYRLIFVRIDLTASHLVRSKLSCISHSFPARLEARFASLLNEAISRSLPLMTLVPSAQPEALCLRLWYPGPRSETFFFAEKNKQNKKQRVGRKAKRRAAETTHFEGISKTQFNTGYLAKLSPSELAQCVLQSDEKSAEKSAEIESLVTLECFGEKGFVGSRYRKMARNVSQSKWISGGQSVGATSVEEIISAKLSGFSGECTLGAAGREDRNVRMRGPGRPFYIQMHNIINSEWRNEVSKIQLHSSMEAVQLTAPLTVLSAEEVSAINLAASQKTKCYEALIRIDVPVLNVEHVLTIQRSTFPACPFPIEQWTPLRVLHRRSRLPRRRMILQLELIPRPESCQLFLLRLGTSAGTYVKEFVHSDFGRTSPSLASLLGLPCSILSLDVVDVRLDGASAEGADEDDDDDEGE